MKKRLLLIAVLTLFVVFAMSPAIAQGQGNNPEDFKPGHFRCYDSESNLVAQDLTRPEAQALYDAGGIQYCQGGWKNDFIIGVRQ